MSATTLNVHTDELRNFQQELAGIVGPIGQRRVLNEMGVALQTVLTDHFFALDRDDIHHRWSAQLGAERTHFYGAAARGVHSPELEGSDGVSVSIASEGLAQRYHGGVITAQNAKWLTIPAVAEAYGKRARSFGNLRFVLFRPDLAGLVERLPDRVKTVRGVVKAKAPTERPRVIYWLKKSVTQAGDESVLPTDDEMASAAIAAGREALQQLKATGATS